MMKAPLLVTTLLGSLIFSHLQAQTISVNLTRSGAPTETGFTNWQSADNSLPADLTGVSFGTDTLTFSAPSTGINAGTSLRSIDRGGNDGYAGTLPSMTQTWWGQRATSTGSGGFITIDIAGLSAGDYSFTGWFLDHEDQTGGMKIEFSDDDGSNFTDATSTFDLVSGDESATGPIVQSFNFTATGTNDVQIRFTNVASTNSSEAFSLTNGFELSVVPEPSSFALLAGYFGLSWVMLRRRSA